MTDFRGYLPDLDELDLVQNPALGAFSLWAFTMAYQSRNARQASLPLAFLVLPLVLHEEARSHISSTRLDSGLAVFVAKLSEQRENLLAVHKRALQLRALTMESVTVARGAKLLSLDHKTARLCALAANEQLRSPRLPERIKWLEPCSQKLGHWFAAMNDEHVARTLRVDY
jgi:hypothetical protein